MATEAAQDSRLGIKDPVVYPAPGLMTRSKSDAVELAVPGLVLLDIGLGIQPTYKCDGLYIRAECPQSRLGWFRRGECAGVSTGRLRARLSGMALRASRGPSVIGRCHREQKLRRQQGKRSEPQSFRELTQARILTDKIR